MDPRRVTSTSMKGKRGDVIVVTLDDESELELVADVWLSSGLGSGSVLDEARLNDLLSHDAVARCKLAAWRMLSRKQRGAEELRRELLRKKFPASAVDDIIADLSANDFLNDERFAKQYASSRANRGTGSRLIARELKQKGVDRTASDEAVQESANPEAEAARAEALLRKWNKRTNPADPRKRAQAAAGFLMRRGFPNELVWELVKRIVGANDEE